MLFTNKHSLLAGKVHTRNTEECLEQFFSVWGCMFLFIRSPQGTWAYELAFLFYSVFHLSSS